MYLVNHRLNHTTLSAAQRSHLNALVAMAVVLVKYDRQFYPHIGFSQGEIVGKVDRNLHDL
ncbi:hypothetical protein [Microcoleus sp. B4-C1]|uniref:hypothetical protein n=1 Tax=Microcoleus sp. B4-C1 TaxID=2818660 RepID=UPI002FD50932